MNESRYFLVALISLFGILALLLGLQFINPLMLGVVLAVLIVPTYNRLRQNLGNRENLAALIALFIVIAVIVVPATFLLILVTREAIDLFARASEYASSQTWESIIGGIAPLLQKLRIPLPLDGSLQAKVIEGLQALGLYISQNLGSLFSGAATLIIDFFIMALAIFYFLRDGKKLGKTLIKISPLETVDELSLFETFKKVLRAVFYGNVLSAIIQGGLGGIGFALFGLGAPILWGAVMAFLALIPLLGPYIIFVPAAIVLYLTKGLGLTLVFLAYNILIVSTIDNFVKPKIIGSKIKIHPFIILMSILGGLAMFGLMGLIYGPLVASILIALVEIYLKTRKNHTLFAE